MKQAKSVGKMLIVPLLALSQLFIADISPLLFLACMGLWLFLAAFNPKPDSLERPTAFFSEVVSQEINYRSNHFLYLLMFIVL